MSGPYILLKSGNLFYFSPVMIERNIYTVDDVASGLAGEPRYSNQMIDDSLHFSVAEHSCIIHDHMPDLETRAQALVHDGPEAFFRDLSGPLKHFCPDYRNLIDLCEVDMYSRLDLRWPKSPYVKHADEWMLRVESEQLLHHSADVHFSRWPEPPVKIKLECWDKPRARAEFMQRFEDCFGALDEILPV